MKVSRSSSFITRFLKESSGTHMRVKLSMLFLCRNGGNNNNQQYSTFEKLIIASSCPI